MTDTSTQAVEAHAKTLDGRSSEFWKYAALLRALAAERDEFVEMVRDLRIETGQLRNDIASARRTALEDAVGAVEGNAVGFGRQECCGYGVHSGGFYGPPECCCDPVYMISNVEAAAAIRALIETTNKEK